MPGLAFALSVGVDALVVSPESLSDADMIEALQIAKSQRLEQPASDTSNADTNAISEKIDLKRAFVTSVVSAGLADRVALDFTSLLEEGEGCLLGSSAKLLSLVLGETFNSTFVPARPFRVNAGPVHQYVLMAEPEGATKYLSEVKAGDSVVVLNGSGGKRKMVVGRAKVEPRPVVKVGFALVDESEIEGNIFLQQAETVRLAVSGGGGGGGGGGRSMSVSVTEIPNGGGGDEVQILVRLGKGTHVGKSIDSRVVEI